MNTIPRLGKREPRRKAALMVSEFLTGVVPDIPESVDYFATVSGWEDGRNSEFGTCGPTAVANHRRLVSKALTGSMDSPSIDEVFDLYRRSGNPRFDPSKQWDAPDQDDNGVYMQDMLDQLLADGIGGRKPVAFAKIAAGDMDTLNKAVAVFGGVILGVTLTQAQQRQTVWDYVSGSPAWGGHAVLAGRYSDPVEEVHDRVGVVTWAYPQDTTRAFVQRQEDECWVVIWPEHLSDQTFLAGVDLAALGSAYQALTGDDLPLPEPTTPEDPAEPVPATQQALYDALARFLTTRGVPAYLRTAAEPWMAEVTE